MIWMAREDGSVRETLPCVWSERGGSDLVTGRIERKRQHSELRFDFGECACGVYKLLSDVHVSLFDGGMLLSGV